MTLFSSKNASNTHYLKEILKRIETQRTICSKWVVLPSHVLSVTFMSLWDPHISAYELTEPVTPRVNLSVLPSPTGPFMHPC